MCSSDDNCTDAWAVRLYNTSSGQLLLLCIVQTKNTIRLDFCFAALARDHHMEICIRMSQNSWRTSQHEWHTNLKSNIVCLKMECVYILNTVFNILKMCRLVFRDICSSISADAFEYLLTAADASQWAFPHLCCQDCGKAAMKLLTKV